MFADGSKLSNLNQAKPTQPKAYSTHHDLPSSLRLVAVGSKQGRTETETSNFS
jgi:hypothetical protein